MPLVRARTGLPITEAEHKVDMWDALVVACEHGATIRACGTGLMLWTHGLTGAQTSRPFEGANLTECVETMMRENARAKTLPPPRDRMQTLPDNIAALRGKT